MAKGGKKKAETVFLVCEETGDYNYSLRRKPRREAESEEVLAQAPPAHRARGKEEVVIAAATPTGRALPCPARVTRG
jgi:hypothetical protein